jgi:hypothetical protein
MRRAVKNLLTFLLGYTAEYPEALSLFFELLVVG